MSQASSPPPQNQDIPPVPGSDPAAAVGMAGVGIFFQQEPNSQLVFVKTIVPGGSADRSKQVFVGDVVTKVNNKDVQGQPLHVLRTLILGKQGEHINLEFLRRDGSLHNVTLQRGTPEYFQSLEKEAPLQMELELLRREVIELGRRHTADTEEINRLRGALEQGSTDNGRKVRALEEALGKKDEEISRLQDALRAAENARRNAEGQISDVQSRQIPMLDDLRRFEEKDRLRLDYIEELKRRLDDERVKAEGALRKLDQDLRNEQRRSQESEAREAKLIEELRNRLEHDRVQHDRDVEFKKRLETERKGVKEAQRITEAITSLLRDAGPRLQMLENDVFSHAPAFYPHPTELVPSIRM